MHAGFGLADLVAMHLIGGLGVRWGEGQYGVGLRLHKDKDWEIFLI